MRYLTLYLSFCIILACNQPLQNSTNSTTSVSGATSVGEIPKAKNIIFLIGDGMGLTQISAGMYLNGNKTSLEKFPVIGIHKSHSQNNLVTDSAAGATAFASGVKTVNGAIGMDHLGQVHETILEEAERKGLATGLLTTSTIVHATPAVFISHVRSRRLYEDIALDFMKTEIDLMIGGGKAYFTRREDGKDLYENLRGRNYYVADYFDTSIEEIEVQGNENLAYFTSDKDPLPREQGRDYLIPATELSLNFLENRASKGFFIMIEGAQIDWGGHANDESYVVDEFLEFDKVIDLCYEFAKKNGETLVLVTADHETGGMAINPESTMRDLITAFTTGGHTATMIPVFAFGPGASRFSGIYDNTKIYDKMRQAYGWQK
jgi:alkaline phosphatase